MKFIPYKSYHFDFGNSVDGPVGYCARVTARNRGEAVRKLQAALRLQNEAEVLRDSDCGIEYIRVYLNAAAVTEAAIDDEEESPEPNAFRYAG